MSDTAYIDELLRAEREATQIIENAQKERYFLFKAPQMKLSFPTIFLIKTAQIEGGQRGG